MFKFTLRNENINKESVNSQWIWHLYFIWRKYHRNKKFKKKDFYVFVNFLNLYFEIIEEYLETNSPLKGYENFKLKIIHSFLLIFDFVLNYVQDIINFKQKRHFGNLVEFEEKDILEEFFNRIKFLKHKLLLVSEFIPKILNYNSYYFDFLQLDQKIKNLLHMLVNLENKLK